MNRIPLSKTLLAGFVAGLASLASPVLAQDAAPASPPPAADSTAAAPGADQTSDQARYIERLAEALGLSDAQVGQIKAILQTSAGQLKAIQDNASLAQDEKSQQLKALKENTEQQINGVLTPGQQQEFAAMRQLLSHHLHRR